MNRLLIALLFTSFACFAQAPEFDAASVKLASPESARFPGRRIETSPGMLVTHSLSLRACILWAYDEPAELDGPDWLNDVRLDIVAKAAKPVGDRELYHMLRTLLEKRLGVKTHTETREMQVYALTLAKGGPKFTESPTDGPLTSTKDKGVVVVQHASLNDLAVELSNKMFDRPVINATGLTGRYDMRIDLGAVMQSNPNDRMDMSTAMMEAMERQLGLKVEKRKAPIEVLVVDQAQKTPTGN